jgi:hypothetical protein
MNSTGPFTSILEQLQQQLFDFSRRNRLLYFRGDKRFLRWREAGGGDVLNTWNTTHEAFIRFRKGESISLNPLIHPAQKERVLPLLLKLTRTAAAEVREYGFHSLQLTAGILHWVDAETGEKISSPLLLFPVYLRRMKGVEDVYLVESETEDAAMNPVLANRLSERFGIQLPKQVLAGQPLWDDIIEAIQSSHGVRLTTLGQTEEGINIGAQDGNGEWEIDTQALVLGSFYFRKMTLAADYAEMALCAQPHPLLPQLFQREGFIPRDFIQQSAEKNEVRHIVAADPTQHRALSFADKGHSFIIQGPPGTGKSQTITNLIASAVMQGKRVLFVCEKRAALDVVYQRLQENGLGSMAVIIHQAQTDKKEFIRQLRESWEALWNKTTSTEELAAKRRHLMQEMEILLHQYDYYRKVYAATVPGTSHTYYELFSVPGLSEAADLPQIGHYEQWIVFGDSLQQLEKKLHQLGRSPFFCHHPFRYLSRAIWLSAATHPSLTAEVPILPNSRQHRPQGKSFSEYTLTELHQLAEELNRVRELHQSRQLDLLKAGSPAAMAWKKRKEDLRRQDQLLKEQKQQCPHIEQTLLASTLREMIHVFQQHENSWFRWFYGSYRRSRQKLLQHYNIEQHVQRPVYSVLCSAWLKVTEAGEDIKRQETAFIRDYSWTASRGGVEASLPEISDRALDWIEFYQGDEDSLFSWLDKFPYQRNTLRNLLQQADELNLNEMEQQLKEIQSVAEDFAILAPLLQRLVEAPSRLQEFLRTEAISSQILQATMAKNSLTECWQSKLDLANTPSEQRAKIADTYNDLYQTLLDVHAHYIPLARRTELLKKLALTERSSAGLTKEEQEEKARWVAARKLVEHETGKSRRHKSIRELVSLESGMLLQVMKPIWLMSPLSVADCLPVDDSLFDWVIFDEASQITVEEGLPSMWRGKQAIVVGDNMQMPPSRFFQQQQQETEDEGEDENIAEPQSSLLIQADGRWPSLMLAWHYRSEHDALIAYSNEAFYGGKLQPVPDRLAQQGKRPSIHIQQATDAVDRVNDVLERPISYHYLSYGRYNKRRNEEEALYIAHLLRALLFADTRLSIGIVAFSIEQQEAIEEAVDRLCREDSRFDQLLEAEMNPRSEGPDRGLFFKSLENVQGDERDVMIMSTGYGYDEEGKMRMHFGPVNQKGGEKRLNVLFTRAKKRVVVVSSIRDTDITNDHNEGPLHLKQYLRYAGWMCTGETEHAARFLQQLSGRTADNIQSAYRLTYQLLDFIQQAGYTAGVMGHEVPAGIAVKANAGDSHFRYLVQTDEREFGPDPPLAAELFIQRKVWEDRGWQVIPVYAACYFRNMETEQQRLLRALRGEKDMQQSTEKTEEKEIQSALSALSNSLYVIRLAHAEKGYWEGWVEANQLIIRKGKTAEDSSKKVYVWEDKDKAGRELARKLSKLEKEGWKRIG